VKVRDVIRMLEQDGWVLAKHEAAIANTNILLN
jgi:DNA-binding FadR family transcriptional regulator